MSKENTTIHLCIVEPEAGRPMVKAVYDEEAEAQAWTAGAAAAYGQGFYMSVRSDEGPIDIGAWLKEAWQA